MRVAFTAVPDSHLPPVDELLSIAVNALGGSERQGQITMVRAVQNAIDAEEHLAVQAGTGTGKSLAYLVPSIRHAMDSDAPVVISTATIALQRQLVDRDLPRLSEALGKELPHEPTYAILKGRRNYLCRYKASAGWPEDDEQDQLFDPREVSATGRMVQRIQEWAEETETGDRDELVPGVSEQAWRQFSVSAQECLGASRCPSGAECFAELARARAGEVDVVVTNHALLAIDAMGELPVLPEHQVVVVDEAHELVDRVTSVVTSELSEASVMLAVRRVGRLIDQPIADQLMEAGEDLKALLAAAPPGRIDELPQVLGLTLQLIRDSAWRCVTALGPRNADKDDPDKAGQRKAAFTALDEVHDTAVRMLDAYGHASETDRAEVVWLDGGTDRRPPALRVAPLNVSGMLRDKLFGERTVVLTSATLALGGTFDALAAQWGLGEAGKDWQGIDVGSPFDHPPLRHPLRRQAPPPARPRRAAAAIPRRDRRADRGGRWAHAGVVLLDAGGQGGDRGAARPARRAAAVPGRRLDDAAGQAVRRGRADLPVRHPVAVAGGRRAGAVAAAGHHRPRPVPPARRPADLRPPAPRGGQGRQRLHGRRRQPRRPAAGPGRRPAAALAGRQGRHRGPRPPPGDGPLQRLPAGLTAAVLAHHRPGRPPAPP
ncbi:hypothetical protein GCM10020001_014780 [Nonomuraea salmonea]